MRQSVIDATIRALAGGDVDAISIPSIAAEAAVSPSTIYRRWPTRTDLITEALASFAFDAVPLEPQPTLEDDLLRFATELAEALSTPTARSLARTLFAVEGEDAAAVRSAFWELRFAASEEIVDRAVRRGERIDPCVSIELFERIAAPIWMRALITGQPTPEDWRARLVTETLDALTRR